MSKETDEILSVIDKTNPYASFLNDSALSNVDGWLDTGYLTVLFPVRYLEVFQKIE
jgi:hypothetical protein